MSQPEPSPPGSSAPAVSDTLLSRFAAVWIWTVFFGVNGGLTYSFLASSHDWVAAVSISLRRTGAPLGPGPSELMAVVLPAAFSLGLVASIASWVFLYLYFVTLVLPTVLVGVRGEYEERRRRLAAAYLARTYQLLILAALARATPEVLYLTLPALERLGLL
jgi:hypothetical protein